MSVSRLRFASRASVATLAVCALATAPAAAEWETIGLISYAGTVASDGLRLVAFQSEDRHVTVLDAEHGSVRRHRIPDDCSPGGFPSLRSVGGGRVLVWCWSPAQPWHLLLLDPASDRWDEVPDLADDPPQRSAGDVSFDALGAHWLRRTIGSRSGLQRTWIDWRTGEQRADASGPRAVPDPDLAQLYVVPCEDMEQPNPLPRAYQMPYGLVSTDRLRVKRCGETASLPVDPAGWGDAARLGGGIVSWGTSAYLIACRVGLSWRSKTARKLVHAGRTLVLTHLPFRGPGPGDAARLVLPAGCPPGPAAQSLAVRVAGGRTARLLPEAASWQTSAAWGEARARVLPGTFPVRRLALARGARVAVSMPSATAVRFAVNRGGWRLARLLDGGEWRFALPARSVARQLRLAVRFADGVAKYRVRQR
ncbi:MAG: hypothetical protein WBC33_02765 [Conexibacter sp.]